MGGDEIQRKIYDTLKDLQIEFEEYRHEAVYTCEEAAALPPIPGIATKNLFLRDRKGQRHFLLTAAVDTRVSMKLLAEQLGTSALSLASPERLYKYLKLTPGAVSPLALVHDEGREVTFVLDEKVLAADFISCHPGINTATVVISSADLERFLSNLGYTLNLLSPSVP